MKKNNPNLTWIKVLARYGRILVLGVALLVYLTACSAAEEQTPDSITASGFIEGKTYTIASQNGGMVTSLEVIQGDVVTQGQVLLSMDQSDLYRRQEQAQAGVDAAQAAIKRLEAMPKAEDTAAAEANLAIARSHLAQAKGNLNILKATYDPLTPPQADKHSADAAIRIAQAEENLAQAALDQVKAGPRMEELEIAKAKLAEAQANLDLVNAQLALMELQSPVNGVVSQVLVHPGEIVTPGAPLAYIVDPNELTLTVYVPVTRIADIHIGTSVQISVDAYPGQDFAGQIQRIADQAQFTPTSVQTQEERVRQVFAVEIQLENPMGKLKPGMPADIKITP